MLAAMSLRLVVVPRWAGTPRSDYYPWLAAQLAAAPDSPFESVIVADLPDPGRPRLDTWPPAIAGLLGDDQAVLEDTFVLGHSVGCQALLHALASLPAGARVAGMLAVAGWWRVDEPWPAIRPWQDQLPDLERVRAALPALTVLLSDDDPFIRDYAMNGTLWRERLDAQIELIPGGRHFNGAEEPAVLATLLRAAAAVATA